MYVARMCFVNVIINKFRLFVYVVRQAEQVPGVTIVSCCSPIYFANSEQVVSEIRQVGTLKHGLGERWRDRRACDHDRVAMCYSGTNGLTRLDVSK